MKTYLCILLLAGVSCAPRAVDAKVIRVPTDQPTVQGGLDSASYGDTVLVATGYYLENIVWPETQNLCLFSESGYDSVTIDGGGTARVITMAVGLTPDTRISGITITNGADSLGGGIYCYQSSPTIERNRIQSNRALCGFGAGLYCEQASPVIIQNVIANNIADRIGGGIFTKSSSLPVVNLNHIYGNRPYYGMYNADASVTVDATNNLWGNSSVQGFGPFDPSQGPPDYNALLPNEMVSDYVSYRPWLTEPGVAEEGQGQRERVSGALRLTISPNPLVYIARIQYTLPTKTKVSLEVYDISGRLVVRLFEGEKCAGSHRETWSITDIPSGIYFCRLEADDFADIEKMILLK